MAVGIVRLEMETTMMMDHRRFIHNTIQAMVRELQEATAMTPEEIFRDIERDVVNRRLSIQRGDGDDIGFIPNAPY